MDQTPHTYHASKHKHSTPLREIPTNLTNHVVQVLQAKHEFLVDRGANGDLADSDEILLSRFDRKPHPCDSMDYSIDPIERSQLHPHFDELGDYIHRPTQTPSTLGFLMNILYEYLRSTDLGSSSYSQKP